MKRKILWTLWCGLFTVSLPVNAQWAELYATYDDSNNGTGHRVASVGVIQEDIFVALVTTTDARSFLIPYVNADSAVGRVYTNGYGTSATMDIYQEWNFGAGFDQVFMKNAWSIAATPDSLIYVANNDDAEHNILVFKFENDTITASPYRQITGANDIWGIDVSDMGYVYVVNDTSNGVSDDIKIYGPVSSWSPTHDDVPVLTIDLPDGVYRGITVSGDAAILYVSDYANRRILKYIGSPTIGYAQDTNFNFQLAAEDTIAGILTKPSVLGLSYLSPNNLLFAAVDAFLAGSDAYSYGRIYVIDPNTGLLISDSTMNVVDAAQWNFDQTGAYNSRAGGTVPGNASGYTSTYAADFDENGNLYSQSYYGWTVEKWEFQGTLPTITSVKEIAGEIPTDYSLSQNYPNPFNPTTTINFSITRSERIKLVVVDLLGRVIDTIVDDTYGPGSYRVTYNAGHLASGIYFYSLRAGGFTSTKKMTLVK